LLGLVLLMAGCVGPRAVPGAGSRSFEFERDTMSYANELVWEYWHDAEGQWRSRAREPKPTYTHHCFVVARSVKQFFLHARFDPGATRVDDETYRRLVRKVIGASPRRGRAEAERIVIPGYGSLRDFSEANGDALREECGGAWQSYWQRGHWRMVFPFSRRNQERVAGEVLNAIGRNELVVLHLVRFPSLRINHAVVVFEAVETAEQIAFMAYDPNAPEGPLTLSYRRETRRFELPGTDYFPGGRVDAYEVYTSLCY
jgi:hypothetical protein